MKIIPIKLGVFLLLELILYGMILTVGGLWLSVSSYAAILLCFAYALSFWRSGDRCILLGLLFTVGADYFLVICDPVQRLWGMVMFLCAQTCYAIALSAVVKGRGWLVARGVVTGIALAVTVIVLGENCDALALVSLCYYGNLIMNMVTAFSGFGGKKLLPWAFVLFLLCDTVIGLQVAAGSYLPIGEETLLYRLIFTDFNLAWFFYLPSQVMIALSANKMRGETW